MPMPFNIPIALTWLRIVMIPIFVAVYYLPDTWLTPVAKNWTAMTIFAVAAITDWLDGYLARRRKQVTALGQLMDPLADKLLITAALVSLVQMDLAPAWMVAIVLGREFAITVLRSLAHSRGVAIPASPLGKFKMASQVTAVLLLILANDGMPLFLTLGHIALWVAVFTAVASAVDYYRRFNHVLTGRAIASSAVNGNQVTDVHRVE